MQMQIVQSTLGIINAIKDKRQLKKRDMYLRRFLIFDILFVVGIAV